MAKELSDIQRDYLYNRYAVKTAKAFRELYGIADHLNIKYPDRDGRAKASLLKRGLIEQVRVKQTYGSYNEEVITDAGIALAAELFGKEVSDKLFQAWADMLTEEYVDSFDLRSSDGVHIRKVENGVIHANFNVSGIGEIYLTTARIEVGISYTYTNSYSNRFDVLDEAKIEHFRAVLANAEYIQGILQEIRS